MFRARINTHTGRAHFVYFKLNATEGATTFSIMALSVTTFRLTTLSILKFTIVTN
jgi:hypothetical protein